MKSVAICASRRFKKEVKEFAEKLKGMGVDVYAPHHHSGPDEWKSLTEDYRKFVAMGLTYDHFQKIKMAEAVFIFNQEGYIGNSVTLEIGYAVALGKPLYALEHDQELCRDVLFKEIVKTPEDLIKYLN